MSEIPAGKGLVVIPSRTTKHRPIDYVLCGYYFCQLVCTTLMDTQGVYPEWLYPDFLKAVYHHYLDVYHDPFLRNAWKYPWFLSMCLVEHVIGLPFFAWASYSYYYGALNRPQIIIPGMIYSTYAIGCVVAVNAMVILEDFSSYGEGAPQTTGHRLLLCFVYTVILGFFLINVIDSYYLTMNAILIPRQ
ncbi:unnamed protein product [Candidula unifasciata]|uniref:EXPERA domain-containing protein n=1 Tax=Candidula unifasciata TaxID=100452 RepID=A0A8S4A3K2_9EUPU|nr:unnamed protein product [Candidula unifasciata]